MNYDELINHVSNEFKVTKRQVQLSLTKTCVFKNENLCEFNKSFYNAELSKLDFDIIECDNYDLSKLIDQCGNRIPDMAYHIIIKYNMMKFEVATMYRFHSIINGKERNHIRTSPRKPTGTGVVKYDGKLVYGQPTHMYIIEVNENVSKKETKYCNVLITDPSPTNNQRINKHSTLVDIYKDDEQRRQQKRYENQQQKKKPFIKHKNFVEKPKYMSVNEWRKKPKNMTWKQWKEFNDEKRKKLISNSSKLRKDHY